ncbi:DUF6248 family natural product biosynthesis protein [Streptomyces sp. Ru62]|uniref:DUF6248 family natural product biosynthesis protein n=1 Tax=Streptomyces sp. Ru62 TaxID=2080745 RepID=UPI0015E41AB2|nr:DUF6248 family natural product biosynthesis protein [Streptomyces sp. Ru62]
MDETAPEEPTPQTCLRVAREAAALAVAAADEAMNAVCRSRSGNTARLEEVMHAAHREATEAEGHAARAEQWAADPEMRDSALRHCARGAVDHAVRAQETAGVEVTAAVLRPALERRLTAQEYAELESERRRAEAEQEAAERAATGMDSDNRHLARMNAYLAESAVPMLGWTVGHVRVLEAAESGRLYWRDGQARQAAVHGVWSGGRRVHRERTQDLRTAGFLTAVAGPDGVEVLVPTPMGQVALELARLHPAGLYDSDTAAYEARYARVAKQYKRMDDKKAAARRLPALEYGAVGRYRRPVTLAEQEARAEREAAEQWEDEGGYCPGVPTPAPAVEDTARCPCCGLHKATVAGVLTPHKPTRTADEDCPGSGLRPGAETPRPAAEPRAKDAPAAAAEPAPAPGADELPWPPGVRLVSLMSTRYRDWWGLECGRCVPGVSAPLPGKWDDKGDARIAAYAHYDEAHRPADDVLTEQEIAEVERWPLSDAQRTVLHWAEHFELREYDDGFWALDCVPDRWDVNKRVARARVTGLWAAGLLDVHLDSSGRRLAPSQTGRRVARMLWRAERQGVAEPAAKDAKLAPLPKRSNGYPLQSEGRRFKGEERPAAAPAPAQPAPVPAAAEPTPPAVATVAAVRADQPLLRRLFAPRAACEQRPQHGVHTVIRRPQRTLTPEEREVVRGTALLNLQGALIMGITDPVPNASPMPEEAGAWVREHVWPAHFQAIERKYPWGFHRWSMCERGTCWNCLSGRCDICVHRQKGGPDVDGNWDSVTNHQGRTVARLILRPDGEPCVWWCRCACPKDGPAPARPAAKVKPAPAAPPAAPALAPVPAATPVRTPEAGALQAALW